MKKKLINEEAQEKKEGKYIFMMSVIFIMRRKMNLTIIKKVGP
jgi:hypothetical protein